MTPPLLTVGIPTYNRSAYLRNAVSRVCAQARRFGLADEVEIVICDNASVDDTPRVVDELRSASPVRLSYYRNPQNVGMIRNIVSTAERAGGAFWMFFGDDDQMKDGALPEILQALRRHGDKAVLMFQQGETQGFGPEALSVPDVARRYFWYLGNAGLQAVRSDLARKGLVGARFRTAWPQTQISFLAMAASGQERPLVRVPIASAESPFHVQMTAYSAWYVWETGLLSLYRTAQDLRDALGEEFFRAASQHLFSSRRILRMGLDMYLHATLADSAKEVRRVRQEVRRAMGIATAVTFPKLAFLWTTVASPVALRSLALSLALTVTRPFAFGARLRRLASEVRNRGVAKRTKAQRVYEAGDY